MSFMQNVRLSDSTKGSAGAAYLELAGFVRRELTSLDAEYFERLATAMEKWVAYWDKSQQHIIPFVASRASTAPASEESTCAVFTVTRNEPKNLPRWLEYYGKHVAADDLWVLDHSSTDGSTAELYHPSKTHKARVKRLTGETHFMPHIFLNRAVEQHQRLLLRSGYKCVAFAEIDEYLVPDPHKYPGGLREYLARFAQGAKTTVRAEGRQIVESANDPKPFDWNKPFLEQRSQWRLSTTFSKPLVSKVPSSTSRDSTVRRFSINRRCRLKSTANSNWSTRRLQTRNSASSERHSSTRNLPTWCHQRKRRAWDITLPTLLINF